MCDLSPCAYVMEWDKPTQARVSRKERIVSIPKWSGSLNPLAFCLILFKLFSETSIFSEKGRECYGLLHTPQCDKSLHLHTERGHTWVILCSRSLFYSTIHCTLAVLPWENSNKWTWNWIGVIKDRSIYLWKGVAEQTQMKWQSQFFGFPSHYVQAFHWRLDFKWERLECCGLLHIPQ